MVVGRRKNIEFEKPYSKVKLFDELGMFPFGGSTIIALVPETYEPTEIGQILERNTRRKNPAETEILVGYPLFCKKKFINK